MESNDRASQPPSPERVALLDPLRGIAAFAVTWFHFTLGRENYLPPGLFRSSGAHGWLGVEIFFVISGFVIPYALWGAGYRLRSYGRFMAKRVLRLDPPYFCAIILAVVIATIAARRHGTPVAFSATQLLLHVGYLNAFVDLPWLNPVFWTLAIEFQYYLLIGLVFPLISSATGGTRTATLLALAALPFLFPARAFAFHYFFLFLLGICTFQLRAGLLRRNVYLAIAASLTLGVWFTLGKADALVAVSTALAIAFVQHRGTAALRGLGRISYSLYLMHVPIGSGVLIIVERMTRSTRGRIAGIFAAEALSIGAAVLLYVLVEKPSRRWSGAVRLTPPEVQPMLDDALAVSRT
jgi:peptidoglycan/LPS O-acetylase OafA/YrhL